MEQNTPKFRLRLNLFDGIVLVLALAALMAASFSTAALAAPAPAPGLSPFVDLAAEHWSYPWPLPPSWCGRP